MNDLPMPSDVKREVTSSPAGDGGAPPPIEPPSAKLIVQLFVVPLVIVALAVGIMFLIGLFAGAGSSPSFERALDRLTPKKRIAFVLRVADNLSLKEIAAQTGATVFTVAQRLRHADRELRRLMAQTTNHARSDEP